MKKLDEIGQILSGGTPSTVIDDYWNGEIAWITPADLSNYPGKFITKGRKNITELGLKKSSARLMPKGAILFSSRAPIGYTVIAANEVATNQGFKSIIPGKTVLSDYVYYYLSASKQKAENVANGTTFKEISLKAFSQLTIPIPSLPVQQVIVFKIEELLSELENGKQQLLIAQQQLKIYRQCLLKWAFEGRLTNKNVKDGGLPEGWKKDEIGNVAKLINGDRGKNYPNRNEYVTSGIPFINTGHIEPNGTLDLSSMNYITREKFNTLNNGKVKPSDLVYCLRGATIGKTAIIEQFDEGAIASSLVILRLNKNAFPKYLYYYLVSPFGKDSIKLFDNGTAQPNLSAKSLSLYQFPLPPLEEQQLIVEELERKLKVCDKIEETITQSLQQSETLRQSILKKAFEGKLI